VGKGEKLKFKEGGGDLEGKVRSGGEKEMRPEEELRGKGSSKGGSI